MKADRIRALESARAQAALMDGELQRFKRRHMLDREAHYRDPVLSAGVFFFLAVVHAAIDGFIFAEVSRGGLLAGAANAALLATPNILLAAIMGLVGWRALLHVRASVRSGGVAVTLTLLAVIGLWNLYVAHLRKLAEATAAAGGELAVLQAGVLSHMLANPFACFESAPATVLFLLGLCAALAAACEGFTFADRYMGYAAVHRRARAAREAIAAAYRAHDAGVTKVATVTLVAINKRRPQFDRAGREVEQILARARKNVAKAEAEMAWWTLVGADCLRAYHDENTRCRPAGTAPARFSDPVLFPRPNLAEFDPDKVRAAIRDNLKVAHAAADRTVTEVKRLHAAARLENAPGSTEPLTTTLPVEVRS